MLLQYSGQDLRLPAARIKILWSRRLATTLTATRIALR